MRNEEKPVNTDISTAYDFLLTLHSNHGPISYRFQDKWRFQSKIETFSQTAVYLTLTLIGLPLELGNIGWYGATRARKKFGGIFSRMGIDTH